MKTRFINKLLNERDNFEQSLNSAGHLRRMTLRGLKGNLTIKDMLVKIWSHEQFIADRMHELLHGTSYVPCKTVGAHDAFMDEFGYPDYDSPMGSENTHTKWITEKYKLFPLEDIIAHELSAFSAIVSALESLAIDTIREHNLYSQIGRHTWDHYREYGNTIRQWFKENRVRL